MRVVLSWLEEFCSPTLGVEELADLLSMRGVHVEEILRPWEGLEGVVVAQVLEVRNHPNSDKLCLARVSSGTGERQLVVGVRNMKPGDLVPLAGPGARVPAFPEPLEARTLRGVESEGMLCSAKELAISWDHAAILVLPPNAPIGADFKATFGLDDSVLDIEVEPHRPDLMSVFGVAREVAAATGAPLTEPRLDLEESGEKAGEVATVEVLDPERCPRYLARIIRGVAAGPSPLRVQARLTAAGMRPVSNVVDATNYAMLELGQPLHAFDLDLLHGHGIVVRRAEGGERLVTLDDVDRELVPDDLVIADRAKAVAIAGVIGSADAEVHAGTSDVLVESAWFERKGIFRTSRRLGLQTEASARFSRGTDPENPPRGADRAARLMTEWAGGAVLAGAIDVGQAPERRRVAARPSRATSILGYEVTRDAVVEVFGRLGVHVRKARGDEVEIEVPSYRVDLEREIDLIEEVVRVQGYENLGSTVPGIRQAGGVAETYALRRRVRETLVRAGLREAISLSFASRSDLDLMGHEGVRMANPVSAEESWLRTSLIPGLLDAVARNRSRGVVSAALFEVGHVFRPGPVEDQPVEEWEAASGVLAGTAGIGFHQDGRAFDFFDAKGVVEAFLEGLGVRVWRLGDPAGWPFHPARSARVVAGNEAIGTVGELHPRVAQALDLPDRTALFELDVQVVAGHAAPSVEVADIPRFPPARRDLAFVVDEDVPAGAMQDALVAASGGLAHDVVLFDVFRGAPIPEGKKSLAFSVELRMADRTLTDQDVDAVVQAVVTRLHGEFGAELRSG